MKVKNAANRSTLPDAGSDIDRVQHFSKSARPAELSPRPTHGHHWFANAESCFLIGEAAGEGMKILLK